MGTQVAQWDPHTHPMVSDLAGVVSFEDFIAGVTVSDEVDEVTGLTSLVVIDPKKRGMEGKDLRPTIRLLDSAGEPLNIPGTSQPAQYFPPAGAIINCTHGEKTSIGDVLARIHEASSQKRDITSDRHRVSDQLVVVQSKVCAILAEASGVVSFGQPT